MKILYVARHWIRNNEPWLFLSLNSRHISGLVFRFETIYVLLPSYPQLTSEPTSVLYKQRGI
jgi:hypothetical protein